MTYVLGTHSMEVMIPKFRLNKWYAWYMAEANNVLPASFSDQKKEAYMAYVWYIRANRNGDWYGEGGHWHEEEWEGKSHSHWFWLNRHLRSDGYPRHIDPKFLLLIKDTTIRKVRNILKGV